ncbi:MAG TPA: cyanophycin synthetase [Blastocatellia bacterium]|nr:cyanophycin synthetase [Blastocatellia bacterium]
MRIDKIRTLSGPNVYSHSPVLLMRLDLQELDEKESREVDGFNDRLLALLPGLGHHHCARGRAGGFVERLREGTYFGHVVEHVALELTVLADIATTHGKTRHSGERGVYNVAIEYRAEHATRYLLESAVALVGALVEGEAASLDDRVGEAKRVAADTELGPSTRAIVEAAERRGIPWVRLNDGSLVQLGYGKARRYVQAAVTEQTSTIADVIAADKDLTKAILERASIPVPKGRTVRTVEEAVAALDEVGPPVVVKPLDGRQGMGVSLNLFSREDVARAFEIASTFSGSVLVEEQFDGGNFRVLVVGGRMVAASERLPCHVTGDGSHTVAELIEIENRDPLRGEGHEKPLTRIKVDEALHDCLSKQGVGLDHVPADGETVKLRDSMNLSTGGKAIDVTDAVHPSVARMCERAARVVGLDICGIDLVTEDITRPLESRGGIIELNAAPGLRMHLFPHRGTPRDVGKAIVDMLYPGGATGRIPLISTTGTNGKTTVTRMIGHALLGAGNVVGMTTTDGIYINGEMIVEGDTTGPASARTVLTDPTVEVAVLETARGGIVRRGLGYDWADVAVLTNVKADHIGQDGIKSVDDILHIKSLVAERVREGGTLVLNADDERLARLTERPGVSRINKRVVYFSLDAGSPVIAKHRAGGGLAYFARDGWIIEAVGDAESAVLEIASMPVALGNAASFQVANAMAAVAACRAYGLERQQVAASLQSFRSEVHNPGRANIYEVRGGHVMIDYGHNPDAFEAVCRMAAQFKARRVTGIIGVPGDRADSVVIEAGRAAAKGFHRLLVREDEDLRGRQRGEVAGLLCRVIGEAAPDRHCQIILDECEALDRELAQLETGDLLVVFYDKLDAVVKTIERHRAMTPPAMGLRAGDAKQLTQRAGEIR